MFPLSKTFEKLPERYPELIDACHRIRGESREEAARAALALFESCREFVEAIGIEWQDGVGRNLLE